MYFKKTILTLTIGTLVLSSGLCLAMGTKTDGINTNMQHPLLSQKLQQWQEKQPSKKIPYLVPRLIENHPYMFGFLAGLGSTCRKLRREFCTEPVDLALHFGFFSCLYGYTLYIISKGILDTCNIPTIQETKKMYADEISKNTSK